MNITTFAEENFGFVPEPDGRGTFGILWSSLAVLFLSTWTVLHLSIPNPNRTFFQAALHKLKWITIATIAPEFITLCAADDYDSARTLQRIMNGRVRWWTVTHGYYANMGGYKVISEADSVTYSFVGLELVWLHLNHFIEIPELSEDSIKQWGNTDSIAKILACAQSLWFLITCLGRAIQQLPFSTLEIFTVSFIGCTWVNYYFWWHKPQGLETITFMRVPHLLASTLDAMEEAVQLGRRGEWRIFTPSTLTNVGDNFRRSRTAIVQMTRRSLRVIELSGMNNLPLRSGRDLLEWEDLMNDATLSYWGESWQLASATFPGILNSAFDIVAWNFAFPTPVESLLWKISTCTTTGLAFATMVYTLVHWAVTNKKDRQQLDSLSFKCYAVVYSFLRLYVIVEVFIGLRALPAGVYRTVNWSKYFPHIF